MHTVSVARSMEGQTTFLEHSQHCQVFRQDFRDELVEPGLAGNRREVTHQCRPNSLPLAGVDYSEGNLGLLRAAEDFSAQRNTRFSGYATYWIKQSIKRALLNDARTVRLPSSMMFIMFGWSPR